MSQVANPSRVGDREARAYAKYIKSSPRKLNLVAQLVRGRSLGDAISSLAFCERRIAIDVRKVLQSALANAENNHNLDPDLLVVKEATVGRTVVMKRFHARGRGRASRIEKPYSNLTVVLEEVNKEIGAK
ncbi:MAG: 50S ribosomal protein L22 [Alphaproteobacteria bacterium]